MWPYSWTHVGTPSHLGHMDRVAATMPSQAHAGAAQEAPNIGQWEGQDVPLVRPSSCTVKGGIPSSRRYLPTYKTKMDKRGGFWQVDLTPNAQELLAFITPQGRVFNWKVMPFGVANAPALFQEPMNKILSILRRRPVVQELISRGAQMEAHIDNVCLGTNTQENHLILLGDFFAVCQENHTRFKLEKCEFMQETMQYLGFHIGYGWWTPAASKAKPLMDAKVRHEDPKKGLHDVRSFIGACNFYRRHIKNFTDTSAILTDLIKKSTTWHWGPQQQQAFDKLKDKVADAKCLGVPRAQGEIILVTDASNVGGGGALFQWQALEKEEFKNRSAPSRRDPHLRRLSSHAGGPT